MSPFFSIVVPTYNHGALIGECINSVISQSFNDWEMVIVNNHSTDNTEEVINSYSDPRIRMVMIHNEGVLAKSRNKGIDESTGEWVCLLDSDDIWFPEKLATVFSVIKEHKPDVVCHSMVLKNTVTNEKKIMECGGTEKISYEYLLMHGNKFQNSSVCVKRSFLQEHRLRINESVDYVAVEDYDFMMQLARHGANFHCVQEPLGYYMVYGKNLSLKPIYLEHLEKMLHEHVYELQDFANDKDGLWKQVNYRVMIKKGRSEHLKGNRIKGLILFSKAIVSSPIAFLRYLRDRGGLFFKRIHSKI